MGAAFPTPKFQTLVPSACAACANAPPCSAARSTSAASPARPPPSRFAFRSAPPPILIVILILIALPPACRAAAQRRLDIVIGTSPQVLVCAQISHENPSRGRPCSGS